MTTFKFQLISITAVFVAVATGLLLGGAVRDVPASASRNEVSTLNQRNANLQAQLDKARGDASAAARFTEQLVPTVIAGRLRTAKVLLVVTPSGVDNVDSVRRMLVSAGTLLTGTLQVTSKFTDPRYDDELQDLAHTVLPSTVVGDIPESVDGVGASSAVLSAALLKRTPPMADANIRTVLASYASQGYLEGTQSVTAVADAVVVVSGPPAINADSARRNAAVLAMTTQLAKAGKVVVAAPTDAGAGNLVAQIRLDPGLRLTVSTVDNAGTAEGCLVVAWALADEIAGHAGQYGTGTGASLVPKVSG